MTVISGRKCLESYERQGRAGLLVRMLLESPIWFNPVVKLTWEDDPISLKSVIEELPHELRKMNMIKHKV